MLAACSGADMPARASDGFVEQTFDSFAGSFDSKLAKLSYRAPALVAAMLEDAGVEAVEEPRRARCRMRHGAVRAARSRRMRGGWSASISLRACWRRRAARNVYDELIKGELTEYLRGMPRTPSM